MTVLTFRDISKLASVNPAIAVATENYVLFHSMYFEYCTGTVGISVKERVRSSKATAIKIQINRCQCTLLCPKFKHSFQAFVLKFAYLLIKCTVKSASVVLVHCNICFIRRPPG